MNEDDGLAIHAIRDLFVCGGGYIGRVRTPCLAPPRVTGGDAAGGVGGLAIHAMRVLFVCGGGYIGRVRTPCLAPSQYTGCDGVGGTDGSWGRMGGGARHVAGHRRAVDEDLLG